jgi:hypothetical protein
MNGLLKPLRAGSKYRITDGLYIGRLCKVIEFLAKGYLAYVEILGPWGEETGLRDHVKSTYLDN